MALCTSPLLLYLDLNLSYTIVLDASVDAARGFFMEDKGEGLRLIEFMSRAFKLIEQRYLAYER